MKLFQARTADASFFGLDEADGSELAMSIAVAQGLWATVVLGRVRLNIRQAWSKICRQQASKVW
jgi:hypothetical protein